MKISYSKTKLTEQKKDALIVFSQEGRLLIPTHEEVLTSLIKEYLTQSSFKGEAGEACIFPTFGKVAARQIILVGLGEAEHFYNGLLEQAAAAAIKLGMKNKIKSFATDAEMVVGHVSSETTQLLIARGAGWGTYQFTSFKKDKPKKCAITLTFSGSEDRNSIPSAQAQIDALLETADLANLPGNEAPPEKIADWAKEMANKNGLDCEILCPDELEKRGCGGILAVGQGSARQPRMIILKHKGSDPDAKPIVLVGKTVTFDSGGISLKPGKGMGWMRYDKSGGMAVLTTMQMIAKMGLPRPVIGILGAAENMPGGAATRPGDIIKAYNGKTIEVLNTDAEGRLVLADALGLAADFNPEAIVDLATLTGAVIGALGHAASALLGNDEKLIDELLEASKSSGERLWQLPLWKDYSDEMKSDFADLSNLSKSGVAGTATAAAFLKEFVPDSIPWAHIDIAGTAWHESTKPHQAAGATLFGARLLIDWVQKKS